MKKAFLFSGQGSQYTGMLKDIANSSTYAKEAIDRADQLLGFKLSEICFDGPEEKLRETRYTQPAIFLHSAIAFLLIKDKADCQATAGHSVGEYAALFAAGAMDFEDALRLVSLRGELMFRAGEEIPGTMFAIIGGNDEKIEHLCKEISSANEGIIVPANFNSPGQVVISGSRDLLREKAAEFKSAGAKMVKELNVSGAFHSPLMEPAKKELEKAINQTKFSDANCDVYTNVYAKPARNADDIKQSLVLQLTSPVLWTQTLLNMKEDGYEQFIEIGPGNVLQGLAKRTVKDIQLSGIDKFEDIQAYLG